MLNDVGMGCMFLLRSFEIQGAWCFRRFHVTLLFRSPSTCYEGVAGSCDSGSFSSLRGFSAAIFDGLSAQRRNRPTYTHTLKDEFMEQYLAHSTMEFEVLIEVRERNGTLGIS